MFDRKNYLDDYGLQVDPLFDIIDELKADVFNAKQRIKIARDIAYEAPELNMNALNMDYVAELNDAMVKLFLILDDMDE